MGLKPALEAADLINTAPCWRLQQQSDVKVRERSLITMQFKFSCLEMTYNLKFSVCLEIEGISVDVLLSSIVFSAWLVF